MVDRIPRDQANQEFKVAEESKQTLLDFLSIHQPLTLRTAIMAAFRSKKAIKPIGSASWISDERDSAQQFLRQEEEEFEYAVINDFEWLNEHMSEIFSKTRK